MEWGSEYLTLLIAFSGSPFLSSIRGVLLTLPISQARKQEWWQSSKGGAQALDSRAPNSPPLLVERGRKEEQ